MRDKDAADQETKIIARSPYQLERAHRIDEALRRAMSDDGEDMLIKIEQLAEALGQSASGSDQFSTAAPRRKPRWGLFA